MSSEKWTPEPWAIGETRGPPGIDGCISISGGDRFVADVRRGWFVYTEKGPVIDRHSDWLGKANADRIVACVNALQGIPDPAAWVAKAKAAIELVALREAHSGFPIFGDAKLKQSLFDRLIAAQEAYRALCEGEAP